MLSYTIQLHFDGLKDVGTSITYPDLIEFLVQRRRAWLSLGPKKPLTRHTQHHCQVYDLVGGAFASTSNDRLEIIWLPTVGNANGRVLQRPSIGISVGDFAMDPTQDLIVFLEDDAT